MQVEGLVFVCFGQAERGRNACVQRGQNACVQRGRNACVSACMILRDQKPQQHLSQKSFSRFNVTFVRFI